MATTKNNSTIAWEKEFDKEFGYDPYIEGDLAGDYMLDGVTPSQIKAFIAQALHRQREELLDSLWMEKREVELEEPRLFQSNPTLNEMGGYSSVPFYCSLCFQSEMDIQDNKLKNGNYFCNCSIWDSPTGGKWIDWYDKENAIRLSNELPHEDNFFNSFVQQLQDKITALRSSGGEK